MREPGRDGKIARPPSPCTEPHRRPNDHARLIVLVLRMDFIQHITTALQQSCQREMAVTKEYAAYSAARGNR
jgi:hypothetical protein